MHAELNEALYKFVYLNTFKNLFFKVLQGSLVLLQFSVLAGSCNSSKVSRCLIIRKPLGQLLMYLIKTISPQTICES